MKRMKAIPLALVLVCGACSGEMSRSSTQDVAVLGPEGRAFTVIYESDGSVYRKKCARFVEPLRDCLSVDGDSAHLETGTYRTVLRLAALSAKGVRELAGNHRVALASKRAAESDLKRHLKRQSNLADEFRRTDSERLALEKQLSSGYHPVVDQRPRLRTEQDFIRQQVLRIRVELQDPMLPSADRALLEEKLQRLESDVEKYEEQIAAAGERFDRDVAAWFENLRERIAALRSALEQMDAQLARIGEQIEESRAILAERSSAQADRFAELEAKVTELGEAADDRVDAVLSRELTITDEGRSDAVAVQAPFVQSVPVQNYEVKVTYNKDRSNLPGGYDGYTEVLIDGEPAPGNSLQFSARGPFLLEAVEPNGSGLSVNCQKFARHLGFGEGAAVVDGEYGQLMSIRPESTAWFVEPAGQTMSIPFSYKPESVWYTLRCTYRIRIIELPGISG